MQKTKTITKQYFLVPDMKRGLSFTSGANSHFVINSKISAGFMGQGFIPPLYHAVAINESIVNFLISH